MEHNNIKSYEYDSFRVTQINTDEEWKQNCYVILDNKKNQQYIIDPGFDSRRIIDQVNENGAPVAHIFATHAHHDHLNVASEVCGYFHLPCIIHPIERKLLMHAPLYSISFAKRNMKIPEDVYWLDPSMEKILNDEEIQIIHTPGHSKGSICILFREALFTGDILLYNTAGRSDLPGADREDLIRSITEIVKINKNVDIFPGHGRKWDMDSARRWWNHGDRV